MEYNKILLTYEWMSCTHLALRYKPILQTFSSVRENGDGGFLADYIKNPAFDDEKYSLARTYLILDNDTNEVIAYFSLRNGFVAANEKISLFKRTFDSNPGIEISNFAINGAYITKHPYTKGVGETIFRKFIIPIANMAAAYSGANILYIFALNNKTLIAHYKSWGFTRLSTLQEKAMHSRIRPRYDEGCIFMYQKL